MDIAARKRRLDLAADSAGRERVTWHGEAGDTCPRCRVQVPADYLLALPGTDICGCLRCLELQAHLIFSDLDALPPDLAGIGGQRDALRSIAEDFRHHIKAIARGRAPRPRQAPEARRSATSRWPARPARTTSSDAETVARPSRRWPKRSLEHRAASAAPDRRPPCRQHTPVARAPGPAEVLGLGGSPSRAEIFAAFRRLALLCHPDYGGTADDFRALVAARDTLLASL